MACSWRSPVRSSILGEAMSLAASSACPPGLADCLLAVFACRPEELAVEFGMERNGPKLGRGRWRRACMGEDEGMGAASSAGWR
ncbi:hypothetical protein ABW21_db0204750 [Orbilia brochopaga]|nr:hypothetical protein ABW21_db0204750 [Drechslerella brochopaga]